MTLPSCDKGAFRPLKAWTQALADVLTRDRGLLWALVLTILIGLATLSLLVMPVAADGDPVPTPNMTPGNYTNTSLNYSINWDPEHGYYTRWWFDPGSDFINIYGFFYGIFLPITNVIGNLYYFVIWSVVCAGLYLYTQGTELPFVVGVLSGAMMSSLMGADALLVMTLTMVFAGGGILTKVLLGRV